VVGVGWSGVIINNLLVYYFMIRCLWRIYLAIFIYLFGGVLCFWSVCLRFCLFGLLYLRERE
jgi:hypothetical protein